MIERKCEDCKYVATLLREQPCKDCLVHQNWQAKHTDVNNGAPDEVNHPAHYTQGGIECIDAIEAALTPEELRGYLKGNCLKYLWRERGKGGNKDIEKTEWYIRRLLGDV